MLITGKIGKDVNLEFTGQAAAQKLTLASGATVAGNLNYTSKNTAQIDPKATVSGQINKTEPMANEKNQAMGWLWRELVNIFSAIVVGLVLICALLKITPRVMEKVETNPGKTMLHGLVIMFILPPIALLLALTIIGLPLALIIGAWWLVATYVARIVTALVIGQLILKKFFKREKTALVWPLILGVTVLWLLMSIPYLGWIFALVAIWLGLGGIYAFASNQLKNL